MLSYENAKKVVVLFCIPYDLIVFLPIMIHHNVRTGELHRGLGGSAKTPSVISSSFGGLIEVCVPLSVSGMISVCGMCLVCMSVSGMVSVCGMCLVCMSVSVLGKCLCLYAEMSVSGCECMNPCLY